MDDLQGDFVTLRPATSADRDRILEIRTTPEVLARWYEDDLAAAVDESLETMGDRYLAIRLGSKVVGGIQWSEEEDIDYRHAGIDIFVDPAFAGRGIGTESIALLVKYLFEERGHHRITIDPAADNGAAIRTYEKVGFEPVGIMKQYERGSDGTFHDGLLMELNRSDNSKRP